MNVNRSEPSRRANGVQAMWSKLYAAVTLPMPVRADASPKPRWVQVTLHAIALQFVLLILTPLLSLLLGFLEPVALPTAAIICCFPIYIWMYYCGNASVDRAGFLYPVSLAFLFILSFASVDGLAAMPKVLLSLAILTPVLATEWMIGKMLLAALTHDRPRANRDLNATQNGDEPISQS